MPLGGVLSMTNLRLAPLISGTLAALLIALGGDLVIVDCCSSNSRHG